MQPPSTPIVAMTSTPVRFNSLFALRCLEIFLSHDPTAPVRSERGRIDSEPPEWPGGPTASASVQNLFGARLFPLTTLGVNRDVSKPDLRQRDLNMRLKLNSRKLSVPVIPVTK